MITVRKQNGVLLCHDPGSGQSRNPSTIWCIKEADKRYNWKDFPEFSVYTNDCDGSPQHYSYSKVTYDRLVPDFNFHAWPESGVHDYAECVAQIDRNGKHPPEVHKVGWIGSLDTSHVRRALHQISQDHTSIMDIISCGSWWNVPGSIQMQCTKYISTPDLTKTYAALIDMEGAGYSGRLKHLLWSHRPLLLVERPYKEYFMEYLQEWVHYIPVQRDLSDVVEKTQWCLQNYEDACKIAENAYIFASEFLTREACYKKWNDIICNLPC